jgi:short-subunit dehydrogenase
MLTELERYRSRENRAIARRIGVMTVEAVAEETIAGIERGEFLIVPGRAARAVTRFARIFPGLLRRSVDSRLARTRRD